jgi:hypothetical protein
MQLRFASNVTVIALIVIAIIGIAFFPALFTTRAEAVQTVLYVDPAGSDSNSGNWWNPLRTIGEALERAQPGMKVRLRTGVYRERVVSVRGGTAELPIIIEADGDDRPVIDGAFFTIDGPKIKHPYITFRRIEVRNTRLGIRIEGAHHVILAENTVHDIGTECMRLRFYARDNSILDNRIYNCGRTGNGEGIYVGTAPEQRWKNDGDPDTSTRNVIRDNEMFNVSEGVDLKEDSSLTVVENNYVHDAWDLGSGGINVRSDRNTIRGNRSINGAGSGFRLGGDEALLYSGGPEYQYGVRNVLSGNVASGNDEFGYKIMATPQALDCSNTAFDNDRGDVTSNFETLMAAC